MTDQELDVYFSKLKEMCMDLQNEMIHAADDNNRQRDRAHWRKLIAASFAGGINLTKAENDYNPYDLSVLIGSYTDALVSELFDGEES